MAKNICGFDFANQPKYTYHKGDRVLVRGRLEGVVQRGRRTLGGHEVYVVKVRGVGVLNLYLSELERSKQ